MVEEPRKCCGMAPVLVKEHLPGKEYRTIRVECPKCGMTTQPKMYYSAAIREWNHPRRTERME